MVQWCHKGKILLVNMVGCLFMSNPYICICIKPLSHYKELACCFKIIQSAVRSQEKSFISMKMEYSTVFSRRLRLQLRSVANLRQKRAFLKQTQSLCILFELATLLRHCLLAIVLPYCAHLSQSATIV